jgi:hypothetical protein
MVPLMSLWIPIVASAAIVFFASFILHMVLPFHRADMRKVPKEDEFLEAMRRLNIPPGDYGVPHASSPAAMRDSQFVEKLRTGPIVFMTVTPGRVPSMTGSLIMWFVFCLVVSVVAAYITGPCAATRCRVSRSVPLCRLHDVRRTRIRPVSCFDLVPERLGHDDPQHHRRADLRTVGGRHVRLAVAAVELHGST